MGMEATIVLVSILAFNAFIAACWVAATYIERKYPKHPHDDFWRRQRKDWSK